MSTPKLAEIAAKLAAHLKRIEGDPTLNPPRGGSCGGTRSYWNAHSWAAGSRVGVRYVSYQGETFLTKGRAVAYLAWLDAGNVGTHYEAERKVTP